MLFHAGIKKHDLVNRKIEEKGDSSRETFY